MEETKIEHNFNEGVEIYSIDKNQGEMIIHLGNLRRIHDEYMKLKNENAKLRDKVETSIEFIEEKLKILKGEE